MPTFYDFYYITEHCYICWSLVRLCLPVCLSFCLSSEIMWGIYLGIYVTFCDSSCLFPGLSVHNPGREVERVWGIPEAHSRPSPEHSALLIYASAVDTCSDGEFVPRVWPRHACHDW